MAWRLAGRLTSYCSCRQVCPCAVDQPPTGPDGLCHGAAIFQVRDGNLDDVDLGGTTFALSYFLPSNFTAGNWKQGMVVDTGASDEQADALVRIMRGQVGGPTADMAALVSEWLGVERASVTVADGDDPTVSVDGREVSIELFRAEDGTPTTMNNAPFGLAPVVALGKASGRAGLFGDDFDADYGEAADFEYSSEG